MECCEKLSSEMPSLGDKVTCKYSGLTSCNNLLLTCNFSNKSTKNEMSLAYGATPVKEYYSAVPHEKSAFKNFACASFIVYCEHISSI